MCPRMGLGLRGRDRLTGRVRPLDTGPIALVLRGLVPATTVSEPQPGHWIERGPQKRLMVFSGRSHRELADGIADQLGVELGDVKLETFANDETYCRFDESIRGSDLFIVQTGCAPIDRHLMDPFLMIPAAKRGYPE